MSRWALVVEPGHAESMFSGWPAGNWLVARVEEGKVHWDAVPSRGVPDMVAGLPTWPPLDGVPTFLPSAVDEQAVLDALLSEPDVVLRAGSRQGERPVDPDPFPDLDAITW